MESLNNEVEPRLSLLQDTFKEPINNADVENTLTSGVRSMQTNISSMQNYINDLSQQISKVNVENAVHWTSLIESIR